MTQTKLSPVVSAASVHQQTPHIVTLPTSQQQQPLGHGKAWTSFQEMGLPVNKFINMLGSEAFWPTGLEEESNKAARILRSFCRMGPRQSLSEDELTYTSGRSATSELQYRSTITSKLPKIK